MLHRPVAFERPPLENGGLGRAVRMRVVVLEREQKRLIGVAGEGFDVLPRRERPVPSDTGIVGPVELLPRLDDAVFGGILELRAKHSPDGFAHRQHRADSPYNGRRQVGRLEASGAANDKRAVALGEGSVLHRSEVGGLDRR